MTSEELKELDQTDIKNLEGNVKEENDDTGFQCDECFKYFTQPANLKQHKMSAHLGIRHPCEHCEYKATAKSNLRRHIYKVHTKH